MREKQCQSQQEVNKLLSKYITCLDMYLQALHDACIQAKRSPSLHYHTENSSVEVIERFITIGKKIQHVLQTLQNNNY